MPLKIGRWRLFLAAVIIYGTQQVLGVSHVPGIEQQVAEGRDCITTFAKNSANAANWTQDRLAAVYLHAHTGASMRDNLLSCSIDRLFDNVGQRTPLDVFVFAREESLAALKAHVAAQLDPGSNRVCFISIPKKQWFYQPRKAQYKQAVNINRYGNYLLMGQWRMLVPYNIITSLGYPYFLQVDDDLMVLDPVKVNIVEEMRRANRSMATHRKPVEYWNIMYGLPELARFYLLSHNLTAKGSLFRHLKPSDMSGLFSITRNWWRQPDQPREGYDLIILYGNFMIMSTQLWQDEKVQDFVTLCVNSGGLERHRWQEQGVFTFIYLLFTDPHELWHMQRSELNWLHTRRPGKLKPICGKLERKRR